METADVVIVGGGISGLAAAVTLCSKSNLDVILVEKKCVGANRTTPLIFPEELDEFGLRESVHQYYTAFAVYGALGATAEFDYQRSALASLDYQKACTFLYERAAGNGLELYRAKAVNWSPAVPDPVQPLFIHLDNGDNIKTKVLIDASGRAQWAAKQLKVRLSPYYSVCYGEYLTGCSFEDHSTCFFLGPSRRYGSGGGWFYPIGQDRASMGYAMLVQNPQQSARNLAAGYRAAKQEFHPFANWVKEGIAQHTEGGIIPVGRIGRFVDHRILIVGDAAGQANPWVMMGANPGLSNGCLCGQVVLRAFAQERFHRATLLPYEHQWSKCNRERFWRTLSHMEPSWVQQTDEGHDRLVTLYQKLPPERQLRLMRCNPASSFQQAYAIVGYARRRLAKWIRGQDK